MKRLTWVKWYMTDWMIGVRRMSWAARGIYMEALALQFHGERLDAGFEAWTELFPGITEADYRQVIRHFEERADEHGNYLVNCRLEAEIEASAVKSEKARANAKQSHSGRSANAQRTLSGRSARRGEESREEQSREEPADGDDAQERATPAYTIQWSEEHGFTGITDKDRADWAIAYPTVDIEQDTAKAHQHLLANPAKQHKRLWRKFLTSWFARTQERGGTRGKVEPNTAPRRPGRDESHIPEDCAPDQKYLFWDGNFPSTPSMYLDTAGNLRSTTSRKIICAADT